MVKRCSYGTCRSDSRYPEGVVFFPFPKPKTQRERCLQWIKQCGRPHARLNVSTISKHTYVCSKHFVNGQPTREFPNPALAMQVPNREQLGRQKPRKKRCRFSLQDASGSTSSTDDAEETQQYVVDTSESPEQPPLPGIKLEREPEGPEHPPLPGIKLEREPEEEQSTEKEKKLEEENNNMKVKLALKETEIERLKAQISALKKRTLTPELLESSDIPNMLEYSTGFTYERFNQLCTVFDIPNNPHTIQINHKSNAWHVSEMPLRSQLLFVLMKLHNNEDLNNLAFRFNVSMQTASNIFNSWILSTSIMTIITS